MNRRIPVKTTLDTVSVALISGGLTMATTSNTNIKLLFGVVLVFCGILCYIIRHTWNSKEWEKDETAKKNKKK